MEEIVKQQVEAMESTKEYLARLIPAMDSIAEELLQDEQEDTWDFLGQIIDGVNWIIEIYNGVRGLMNTRRQYLNEEWFAVVVDRLSRAYMDKNKEEVAEILKKEMLPIFVEYDMALTDYLSE